MALLFSDSGVMEVWPDGWLACIEGWGEVFWSLSKKNVFKSRLVGILVSRLL